MEITNPKTNLINQTYSSKTSDKIKKENSNIKEETGQRDSDKVNLSNRTKDIQKIFTAMDNNVENKERATRIANIKEDVQANKYKVDAEKIAEKMVKFLMDT
ncbi:MAG: flagellar biosynthesis anti-sigma factor FlgM [Desulfobacteraceae bacterium 4572_130]|nr:MAG: flagellar biosynthesis anti-sigma factor FlgM [Desulfobacteraceae bacterium 4572_130]